MRFESLVALAVFLAIPGEAVCYGRGYRSLREQAPRDYHLREQARHHVVAYSEKNFVGFGVAIDFHEDQCTDIRPKISTPIESIRIPEDYECTFYYDWKTCSGQDFVITDPEQGQSIPFWPGSFICSRRE